MSKLYSEKITLLEHLKFSDIDTIARDDWKEAIKKSTKVKKRGSKAQEK